MVSYLDHPEGPSCSRSTVNRSSFYKLYLFYKLSFSLHDQVYHVRLTSSLLQLRTTYPCTPQTVSRSHPDFANPTASASSLCTPPSTCPGTSRGTTVSRSPHRLYSVPPVAQATAHPHRPYHTMSVRLSPTGTLLPVDTLPHRVLPTLPLHSLPLPTPLLRAALAPLLPHPPLLAVHPPSSVYVVLPSSVCSAVVVPSSVPPDRTVDHASPEPYCLSFTSSIKKDLLARRPRYSPQKSTSTSTSTTFVWGSTNEPVSTTIHRSQLPRASKGSWSRMLPYANAAESMMTNIWRNKFSRRERGSLYTASHAKKLTSSG